MAINERDSSIPQEVLLARGVSFRQAKKITSFLAGNGMIQALANPSISEWRRNDFHDGNMTIFKESLPPLKAVELLIPYAQMLHGGSVDLLLRTITIPGRVIAYYPDREDFQTLVLLEHGEATAKELSGR